jgi:hypothetical protein
MLTTTKKQTTAKHNNRNLFDALKNSTPKLNTAKARNKNKSGQSNPSLYPHFGHFCILDLSKLNADG